MIFLLSDDQKTFSYAYEWCAEGQTPHIGTFGNFDVDSREEWVDQIQNKTVWIIPDVDALDERSTPGKKRLQEMNVNAMISMPFEIRGRMRGFLSYVQHEKTLAWQAEHRHMLGMLTNLLSDTFLKADAETEINALAYRDALTGLPNRAYFSQLLAQAVASAKKDGSKIAVAFIDLDSFKSINDTTGHDGGDAILRMTGRRLAGVCLKTAWRRVSAETSSS